MKKTKTSTKSRAIKKALSRHSMGSYVLKLYVAGATERSRQAIKRAQRLCEAERDVRYVLEVIDVYQQPILARDGQIIATPTLVREFPRPVRRFFGNLANTTGLFVGLNVETMGTDNP